MSTAAPTPPTSVPPTPRAPWYKRYSKAIATAAGVTVLVLTSVLGEHSVVVLAVEAALVVLGVKQAPANVA